MNKYIARVKEFAKDHELAIAVVAAVVAVVEVERIYRGRIKADACLNRSSHVYLTGTDGHYIEEGGTFEFGDLAIMTMDTWNKLKA